MSYCLVTEPDKHTKKFIRKVLRSILQDKYGVELHYCIEVPHAYFEIDGIRYLFEFHDTLSYGRSTIARSTKHIYEQKGIPCKYIIFARDRVYLEETYEIVKHLSKEDDFKVHIIPKKYKNMKELVQKHLHDLIDNKHD